jgi:hypothetical protein
MAIPLLALIRRAAPGHLFSAPRFDFFLSMFTFADPTMVWGVRSVNLTGRGSLF